MKTPSLESGKPVHYVECYGSCVLPGTNKCRGQKHQDTQSKNFEGEIEADVKKKSFED